MAIYEITARVEAKGILEAWDVSSQGHPKSFQPNQLWGNFKSFRIVEVGSEISMEVTPGATESD